MGVHTARSRRSSIGARTAALMIGLGLVVAGMAGPATGSPRGGAVVRFVSSRLREVIRPGSSARGTHLATRAGVTLYTVDSDAYTGYESAVYAADDSTIYIAYKRFTQDPSGGGYVPADLRVAKSVDGGQTWNVQVVDPNAIEQADTLDNSVSIDGSGSTIYVAYHTRSSGLFADMKLKVAKSTNGGASWTRFTVADANVGDHNSVAIARSPSVVWVSAHGAGTDEGLHVFVTRKGGTGWSDRLVEGGLGNGYYTSIDSALVDKGFVSYYDSLYPDDTNLHGARRTETNIRTGIIDGPPGDLDITGLGSSICVAGGAVLTAYEADTSQGTFVRVAKATFGQSGWTIVPVQQGSVIGWNTAIHAPDSSHVYVSYWLYDGSNGHANFATSADGGSTWTPSTIPEPGYVQPYLDSTAPSTATQYVSYQTYDLSTGATTLRLAKIQP
jgi:hypothetical protein